MAAMMPRLALATRHRDRQNNRKRRRGEALAGHRRAESVLSGPLLRQAPLARLGMVAHAENDAFAAAVAISVGKPERARNGPRAEDGFPGCDFQTLNPTTYLILWTWRMI